MAEDDLDLMLNNLKTVVKELEYVEAQPAITTDELIPFQCSICNQLFTSPIIFTHHCHTAIYKDEKVIISYLNLGKYSIFVPSRQKKIWVKSGELSHIT